jgi:hypothetical protein
MMMYPEIQRKAQAEIDTVIGIDRVPTLADQVNLPYVAAVVKEVLRWGPASPIGKLNVLQSHGVRLSCFRETDYKRTC